MRLRAKVAIVTGAASGIGRATAELFAEEGAKVVVADIDSAGGEQTVSNILSKGGEARFVRADISKEEDAKRICEETVKAFGRIDILINNAAAFVFKRLEEATVEDWQRALSVNIMGTALCTKYAVEHMKKGGGGSVVNVGRFTASSASQDNCPMPPPRRRSSKCREIWLWNWAVSISALTVSVPELC
jgi:NAD(P)-dependent dehydrogenase (short-subunit alcohol dehydrogenase family)